MKFSFIRTSLFIIFLLDLFLNIEVKNIFLYEFENEINLCCFCGILTSNVTKF